MQKKEIGVRFIVHIRCYNVFRDIKKNLIKQLKNKRSKDNLMWLLVLIFPIAVVLRCAEIEGEKRSGKRKRIRRW